MFIRVFILFLFALNIAAAAGDPFLFSLTDWSALVDQSDGSKVKFGIELGKPASFQRNESLSFVPASTAKLFTAGMALEFLGSSFRYETQVQWQQSENGVAYNVVITGSGDPTWGLPELGETVSSRVATLAMAMKEYGVTSIVGQQRFESENLAWENEQIPEGWDIGDADECYGALAHSFNLNLNCAAFQITSLTTGAWREEGLEDLPIEFHLVAGEKTVVAMLPKNLRDFSAGFSVQGTWKNGATETLQIPIRNTKYWLSGLFSRALKVAEISILPSQDIPENLAKKRFTFYSAPLGEILKPFLKNSINLLGDAILKSIGEHYSFGNSANFLNSGRSAVQSYLQMLQIPGEAQLYDGAGLSRKNAVSPAAMLHFLSHLTHAAGFPYIWEGLPIAGVDGTLSSRMKGTAAEGVLRAKTGSMSGIYNLAGFVPGKSGFIPFVMFTDSSSQFRVPARAAEDRVGAKLAELTKVSGWHRTGKKSVDAYPYYPEHNGERE